MPDGAGKKNHHKRSQISYLQTPNQWTVANSNAASEVLQIASGERHMEFVTKNRNKHLSRDYGDSLSLLYSENNSQGKARPTVLFVVWLLQLVSVICRIVPLSSLTLKKSK